MSFQDNGQPPQGIKPPIFQAMNDDRLVAYVPRPVLCMLVLLCVGVGVLSRSWGAILLYVVLHALAAYATYRDPRWLPVLVESLRIRQRLYRLRFRQDDWSRQLWRLGVGTVAGVFLLYVLSLWLF